MHIIDSNRYQPLVFFLFHNLIYLMPFKITDEYDRESLRFEKGDQVWYRPGSLDELLRIKSQHPTARLIAGNTDVGNNFWIDSSFR